MSISPYKTFVDGEALTAADLNASFLQITNAGVSVVSPLTATLDADAQEIILDADADSSITADTDDRIDFRLQGQDLVKFDGTTASAVNGLTITASATGSAVQLTTHGSDTNIGLTINPKGSGSLLLDTPVDINGQELTIDANGDSTLRETSNDVIALKLQGVDSIIFDGDVASPVNGMTLRSSATGTPVEIAAHGTDSNIGITLTPKGSGAVKLGSSTVTATPAASAVPIADGSGTLNSWITAAGGTSMVLLNTYSPSGASSVDITSQLSSTYESYLIKFQLRTSADGAGLYLRTDSNNGASFDSGASNYQWCFTYQPTSSTSTAGNASTGDTQIQLSLAAGIGNATNEGIAGDIKIEYRGSANMYPVINFFTSALNTTTLGTWALGTGNRNSAAAIDAVQLYPSSGTVTGFVKIYGLKAS